LHKRTTDNNGFCKRLVSDNPLASVRCVRQMEFDTQALLVKPINVYQEKGWQTSRHFPQCTVKLPGISKAYAFNWQQ